MSVSCLKNVDVLTDVPGLMFQVKGKGQFRNLIKSSGFLKQSWMFQVVCSAAWVWDSGEHGEVNTHGSPQISWHPINSGPC